MTAALTFNQSQTSTPAASSIPGTGNMAQLAASATNTVPNPLHQFASYNYIITFAALTKAQVSSTTPLNSGDIRNIIAKTAGDWGNSGKRASSSFGKFDYFLEDLVIHTIYGFPDPVGNSFATNITFKIVEPYSMGLLLSTMQVSALSSGYKNYREAPYVLCIEFKGWDDTGQPVSVAESTRMIPIMIKNITFTVTQAGAVYEVEAMHYAELAFTDAHSMTFRDVQISGDTVEKLFVSLQDHININLESVKKQLGLENIDNFVVESPTTFTDPLGTNSGPIWASKVFHDYTPPGQKPYPHAGDAYDSAKKIYLTSKIPVDIKDKTFHFKQNAKIQDILNEIIIRSDYIKNQINEGSDATTFITDVNGMINWWRIETFIQDGVHSTQLNRPVRTFIFRATPYKVHVDKFTPPGIKTPGVTSLTRTIAKAYNYIYTGKNIDILNFNIEYNYAFRTELPSDLSNRPRTDYIGSSATAGRVDPLYTMYKNELELTESSEPTRVINITSSLPLADNGHGGSGSDDRLTVQIKNLKKILENPVEMLRVEFEILGDPYYLPSSGMGNQIGAVRSFNLMQDGSLNYQSGEVDVLITFKTPIDLNLETGLYNFDKSIDTFSGLYMLQRGECRFIQGKYTNLIMARRRILETGGTGTDGTQTIIQPVASSGKRPLLGSERF